MGKEDWVSRQPEEFREMQRRWAESPKVKAAFERMWGDVEEKLWALPTEEERKRARAMRRKGR